MRNHFIVNKENFLFSTIKFFGILLFFTLIIEWADVDARLADTLYTWEGQAWQLKNSWFTSILIHKGGKYLSITILLVVLSIWYLSFILPILKHWKNRLQYVLIASLSGTLFVSATKSISNISCPWDFSRYGGTLEYLSLMNQLWVRNGSHCFPAGHASAGYAWVAFYFAGLHTRSVWRWWGLAFSVLFGSIFGLSQQLRGAHFLSHDLWSFGVCWITSFICYRVFLDVRELVN